MPTTERRTRRIDERLPRTGQGTLITLDTETVPEAVPTPQQVTGLAVTSTFLAFTSIAPQAVANLRWHPIAAPEPESYLVQWALDSGFTDPTTTPTARAQTTAAVDGLPPGGTVYFRVAAVWRSSQGAWSASVNSTMPVDTTPPAAPTSPAGNWSPVTGDLTLTWTNPTSANFKDVEVRIYGASGDITPRRTVYSTTGLYVYTLAQNNQDTTNNPDPSLYIDFRARNYNNVYSATSATLTTTLSAPATPSGLATDFTSPDLVATWTASNSVAGYEIQFGTATIRDIGFTNTFTYSFAQNAADNGSPATTVAVKVWAVDALGQVSASPASASAVTPLPVAPTAVTLNGFFSTLTGTWTHSPTRTFRRYRCRLTRGGVDLVTAFTTVQFFTASVTSSGSYELFVRTEDVFGQTSAETSSGTTTLVSLSIDELRANAIYSDSVPNSVTTLAALKDNNTTSGGVTYNSSATYRWTEMARSLEDRYKTLTIGRFSTTTTGTTFYVRTFDGTNTKWFAGSGSGNVSITGDVATLTNYATEQLAATNAINYNNYTTRTRWELPTIEESVNIRLYHRNTAENYILYEFYPRRLVQSDDIQAESILAINIAAGTITGDRISSATTITAGTGDNVGVLDGADATWRIYAGDSTPLDAPFRVSQTGELIATNATIAGTVTSGTGDQIAALNGAAVRALTDGTNALTDADGVPIVEETFRIYAGNAIAANAPFRVDQFGNLTATSATISGNITSNTTITGATIQTSASGARVVINPEGLETYNASNVLQVSATTANGGEFRAGGGKVKINSDGIILDTEAAVVPGNASIRWYVNNPNPLDANNGNLVSYVHSRYNTPFVDENRVFIVAQQASSSHTAYVTIGSSNLSGTIRSELTTYTDGTTSGAFIRLNGTDALQINSGNISIPSTSEYRVGTNKVVGARITGWGAPTGTATRTTFATGTVTLEQLAERVKALIDDLTTHGLIG